MKENAFTDVSDPAALQQAANEINGKLVQQRIDYWMNLFFKFDKGKYSTLPFDHPILDHNDQKVTPPDFRKDRQLALCQELLKPKYSVHGFKTADLKRALDQFFGNSAQIRYEMKKLLVRGAIKKQKNQSF